MSYMWLDSGVSLFFDLNAIGSATTQGEKFLTILCLHGLGSSHCFFEGILPHFKDLQIPLRVVRIDIEGSGFSPLRKEWVNGSRSSQSITSIADQTFELLSHLTALDELPHMGIVIVGHSMSAITACEMAIASPERTAAGKKAINIIGLVLIGPVVPSDASAQAFAQRIDTVNKGEDKPRNQLSPRCSSLVFSSMPFRYRCYESALTVSGQEACCPWLIPFQSKQQAQKQLLCNVDSFVLCFVDRIPQATYRSAMRLPQHRCQRTTKYREIVLFS